MNGQESASTTNQVDSPKVFIESKLKANLVHVYDATRISNEIKDLENKYQTLQSFRAQLSKDSNSSPAPALGNLTQKIDGMQRDIDQKKEEMKTAENKVIIGFQDIMQFLMERSEDGLKNTQESMRIALGKFGASLTGGFETSIKDIRKHITELDNNKLDANEKANILTTIDAFKSHIVELQKNQITAIKNVTEQQYITLAGQINKRLEGVNADALTTQVQKRVMDNLDGKFRQHLQEIDKAQKALPPQENNGQVSEKIVQTVRDEVKGYLTPETLKSIISTLPEYQALQSLRPEAAPMPDTVKKIIADLQSEVADLKTKSYSTRALVNNLVDRNLSPTDKEAVNAHHSAAIKHIEEMEKSIQFMHNNMKMMEAVMSVQVKRMDEDTTASTSRKRPRKDDDLEMVDQQDGTSNREVLKRITEVEMAHQKLLDFIFQWKDTVLNENFSVKLGNAFKKIEEVLLNHQTFIAFLTDPFTTSKTLKARETASIPQSTTQPSSELNPAMLDAISLLVKQTAEEISLPLKEKIKALEDKLNARQQ